MRTFWLALAVLLCVPAVAEARTWRGETEQDRPVMVRTGDDGTVKKVRLAWKARCRNGNYTSSTFFKVPFDLSTASEFRDAGTYRSRRLKGGYRARHTVAVRGTLGADDRWTGTFRVRTRVMRRGRLVDRCRRAGVSWSAAPR